MLKRHVQRPFRFEWIGTMNAPRATPSHVAVVRQAFFVLLHTVLQRKVYSSGHFEGLLNHQNPLDRADLKTCH